MPRSLLAGIALVGYFLSACGPPAAITPTPLPTAPREAIALPQSSATAQPGPSQPAQAASATQALQARVIVPMPVCSRALPATPAQTEGPFYRANPPERTSLVEPGMRGARVVIVGYVLTTDCKPIPRALVDFWQANDKGEYDNIGFRMRGKQFADEAGRYSLETILPGLYTGRARHIHVKVQPPNRAALTTQLYFPNEAGNQRDTIYNPALLVNMPESSEGKIATFNFVLAP